MRLLLFILSLTFAAKRALEAPDPSLEPIFKKQRIGENNLVISPPPAQCEVNPQKLALDVSQLKPREQLISELHALIKLEYNENCAGVSSASLCEVLKPFTTAKQMRDSDLERALRLLSTDIWHAPLARLICLYMIESPGKVSKLVETAVEKCDFSLMKDLIDYGKIDEDLTFLVEYLKKHGLKHATHVPDYIRKRFEVLPPSFYKNVRDSMALIFTDYPQNREIPSSMVYSAPYTTSYPYAVLDFLCQLHYNPMKMQVLNYFSYILNFIEFYNDYGPQLKGFDLEKWLDLRSMGFRSTYSMFQSNNWRDFEFYIRLELTIGDYRRSCPSDIVGNSLHAVSVRWLAKNHPHELIDLCLKANINQYWIAAAWLHPPFAEVLVKWKGERQNALTAVITDPTATLEAQATAKKDSDKLKRQGFPDKMPPITDLIIPDESFSFEKYRYFQAIISKYGYEELRKAMKKKGSLYTPREFLYLDIFYGTKKPRDLIDYHSTLKQGSQEVEAKQNRNTNLLMGLMPIGMTITEEGLWWEAVLRLSTDNAAKVVAQDGKIFLQIGSLLLPFGEPN